MDDTAGPGIAEAMKIAYGHADADTTRKALQAVIDQRDAALAEIERLRALITEWADACKGANVAIGGFNDDIEEYTDACDALRKAVGR